MTTCETALSEAPPTNKSTSGFICWLGFTVQKRSVFQSTVAPPVVRKRAVSKLTDNWGCCLIKNNNTRHYCYTSVGCMRIASDKV